MGGKKKTKWRKLPLEEFTKEIPSKPEKEPPHDEYQTDPITEENAYIPSYNEQAETAQNYTQQYEYVDGVWYSTSCVTEVGLYSNYMMPLDYYYYYAMPEMPQMQEYVRVPYQEYTSALPKDTVYLLLPDPAIRLPQPVQSSSPECQNRRRRRHEGYADYAVVPEKPSSTKAEERDHSNVTGQIKNSRKNSAHYNNSKKMTSETSKCNERISIPEQNPSCSKSNDGKKSSVLPTDMNNAKGPMFVSKERECLSEESVENNEKCKKNLEICSIHSRNLTQMKSQAVTEINSKNEYPDNNIHEAENSNKRKNSSELLSRLSCIDPVNNLSTTPTLSYYNKTQRNKLRKQSNKTDDKIMLGNKVCGDGLSFEETKNVPHTPKENTASDCIMRKLVTEVVCEPNSLPDILSTLNQPQRNKVKHEHDDSGEGVDIEKGISPKPKSFSSQTSYLTNLSSSEALHNEMEMELKQLQSLNSLKANQSIYKLAYDENVTDQSEADSRSPSPTDPESQVPSSITSAEILIHEADSGSDAGSEDVELLPHRYESETFRNESKHVYVNKLSLAVELLRTQESLPYDDEFKRVVRENQSTNNIVPAVPTHGKINLGFMEDSHSPNSFSISQNKSAITNANGNYSSLCQLKHSIDSNNDSAIFSDIEFDNFEEESCETAKEAVAENSEAQDNTQGIRAGYRRLGVQARHYFSQRALSLNPCFCCIIM